MSINKKLLIGTAILLTVGGSLAYQFFRVDIPPAAPGVSIEAPKEPDVSDIDKSALLTLTNAERIKADLPTFTNNSALEQSAMDKCNDMVARNYWSHNTPEGMEPWTFIHKYTKYRYAGENLAYGYDNATETVEGWMNSPTHKENILRNTFTQVGYAVCESGNYVNAGNQLIVVQHLIGL